MFKPGQLVQSVKYGDYYVVHQPSIGFVTALPLAPKFWFSATLNLENERIRLIGNNYRSKK